MNRRTAVIIGAGPAGLTAAFELLRRTDIHPVVLEQSDAIGGIAQTSSYKGNRIDLGGHRFFSKSDRVMEWWLARMPLQRTADPAFMIGYQGQSRAVGAGEAGPAPEATDRVMLVRERRSRIYWRRQLFEYPLRFSLDTVRKMGPIRMVKAGVSYLRAAAFPIRPEKTLEQFLINRFGRELYHTFFQAYTEKVWGVPCREIPADWGAQRIKGLSITRALAHAIARPFRRGADVGQKGTETSLIEKFLYPKYGPGQMWEIVADDVRQGGGEVHTGVRVTGFRVEAGRIVEVHAQPRSGGDSLHVPADFVFSSMPIDELVRGLGDAVPTDVRAIAEGLVFRDFFTVGLLVHRLRLTDPGGGPVRDNWIYIQEPDVLVGRLQIFNNWSPYLVADPSKTWLGLEYFCNASDEIWSRPDARLIELGRDELAKINIIDAKEAIDGCVIRMRKTYPAYFGAYARFGAVRTALDRFENLFCIGRNGQHRYNNQDHSMLTAMLAVDYLVDGRPPKAAIWDVNVEQDYHETK